MLFKQIKMLIDKNILYICTYIFNYWPNYTKIYSKYSLRIRIWGIKEY